MDARARVLTRAVPGALALAVLALQPLRACVWDTDTIRDEVQMHAGTFDLISGQFPHHGAAYYEARARRLEQKVMEGSLEVAVLNDLAVAYVKLGRSDEARAQFDLIEGISPGRYETLSNLGVLEKKRGNFAAAAGFTEQALALRPEGHLGLGDYYLGMLRWREAAAREPPRTDFLGVPYDLGPRGREEIEVVGVERLEALIRSDRSFSDAFLVLGDYLQLRFDEDYGELNLALWSYVRALDLGHPRADVIHSRIEGIFAHWKESVSQRRGVRLESQDAAIEGIRADLARASTWLATFEAVEGELAASLEDVDFALVEAELARRGIAKVEAKEHGLRSYSLWALFYPPHFGMGLFLLSILAPMILFFLRTGRRPSRCSSSSTGTP